MSELDRIKRNLDRALEGIKHASLDDLWRELRKLRTGLLEVLAGKIADELERREKEDGYDPRKHQSL